MRLLGKGGMGEVYAAYDSDLDRNVAIKLLRSGSGNDSDDGRLRLLREAQAIARVSHPNVVVVYEAGTFHERVFIAMELVDGNTMGYWMHARKRTWPEVLEVFVAAGRGLAAAHERQLVHRDFKPDNVMIGADGQVRVMDFGLVQLAVPKGQSAEAASTAAVTSGFVALPSGAVPPPAVLDEASEDIFATRPVAMAATPARTVLSRSTPALLGLTQQGASLGTPAYMSPEQFRGEPTDARTDQFSFCVSLYEALYGERPFAGNNMAALEKAVVGQQIRPAPDGATVPAWLREALLKGLSTNVERRWPSMNVLLAALEKQPAVASRRRFAAAAVERLAGIWEVPSGGATVETTMKAEMRRGFLASGKRYAAKVCEGAIEILDRYARRWSEVYVEACEATHVRGEQSAEVLDLRMACLQEGLEDLKALCRMFRDPTAEVVENAVSAANALGGLERCDNIELLRAVVRPPQDAATRDKVTALRADLAEARALHRVGRFNDGLAAARAVEEGARAVQYAPLLAEALITVGVVFHEQGLVDAAAKSMEQAVWTALICRHQEVAAEAAAALVYVVGHAQARFEVAEVWSNLADTLIRAMGENHLLRGWLLNNRGTLRESQGRLEEALSDAERAVEAKQKVLAPGDPDLGSSLSNIGIALDALGRMDEALDKSRRAVEIVSEALGPDHPRTAVMLSNYGELLARCDRFDEAADAAGRALTIFDREMDPNGLYITYPLIAFGVSRMGQGRIDEARSLLQRAYEIRERLETAPARRGDIRFALARAIWASGKEPAYALQLAGQAQNEYEQAPATPAVQRELAAIVKWRSARQ